MIRNIIKSLKSLGGLDAWIMQNFRAEFETASKIAEAENELATVTSGGFVRAISPVMKELSYMSAEPGTEVYIRHLNHATELILDGNEQAEVIDYYDAKLEVMKRGGVDGRVNKKK